MSHPDPFRHLGAIKDWAVIAALWSLIALIVAAKVAVVALVAAAALKVLGVLP